MRSIRAAFCSILLVTTAATLPAVQNEGDKPKIPKRGDTIVVKGCLEGPLLRSTETSILDQTGHLATPLTYQLRCDKKLLTQMRDKHDGYVIEVTGELKSTLPQPAGRGVQVGEGRIVVGMGATPAGAADRMSQASESLPVLSVKSFDGTSIVCRD
jgi:hypothetical protein